MLFGENRKVCGLVKMDDQIGKELRNYKYPIIHFASRIAGIPIHLAMPEQYMMKRLLYFVFILFGIYSNATG